MMSSWKAVRENPDGTSFHFKTPIFNRMIVSRLRSFAFAMIGIALSVDSSVAQERPLRILPLGDSITHGVGGVEGLGGYRGKLKAMLSAKGYDVDFIGNEVVFSHLIPDPQHQGHSGWRIDQIAASLPGWLANIESPDVVLLHIGTNDFGQGYQITTALNRLDALIGQIAALKPNARIIVTNLMEREEPKNTEIQTYFNPSVQAVVNSHASAGRKVSFLNMRAAVPLSDMPDLLHPNQTGFHKMAGAWFGAITSLFEPPNREDSPIRQVTLSSSGAAGTSGVDLTYASDVSGTDLLHGLSGTYSGWVDAGMFSPSRLNDGAHGASSVGSSSNEISFSADVGTSATFILGVGANGFGYDISSVVSIASWRDSALFQQSYEIWVRTKGTPNFRKIHTVTNDLDPVGNLTLGGSSKVTVDHKDGGVIASGIDAIRFVPLDVPAGYEPAPAGGGIAFREIDVFGVPATAAPADTIVHSTISRMVPGSTSGGDMTYSSSVSSADLLHGVTGIYEGWQSSGTFSPANLNNGQHGVTSVGSNPDVIAFAADSGSQATFELGTGSFGLGYDVSSIVSVASWRDSSLLQQHYEIWIRRVGQTTFEKIHTVTNDLAPLSDLSMGGSTRVTVSASSGGPVATGIEAIRFVPLAIETGHEPTPGGGSTAFREIDVFGSSTTPPPLHSDITQVTEFSTGAGSAANVDMTYVSSVSDSDLLHGKAGVYSGWQLTDSFNPANLNNGTHGPTSVGPTPNAIAFAADSGTTATYELGTGIHGLGYSISSIVSVASWRDSSLFQQHYEIWVRKVGATEFVKQYTVANDLAPISSILLGGSTKVTVSNPVSGKIATGVEAIRFVILDIPSSFEPSPGGGSTTFREIDVFGEATAPASDFDSWAESFQIDPDPAGDSDFDGIPELVEYAAGSHPKVANGAPVLIAGGEIVFEKGALAVANGDITYAIEVSESLETDSWERVTPDVDDASSIRYLLPTTSPKLFARVVITTVDAP